MDLRRQRVVVGLLAVSAVLLVVAPVAVPDDYSWVRHTLSEAAAQGVPGAWLARTGLTLFGVGTLVLSWSAVAWGVLARLLHGAFGLALAASAVFPSRSWVEGASYEETLDALHSVAATGMGFAFAIGVVCVAIYRRRMGWLDAAVVAASVALPLGMALLPDSAGLLQRVMFALAYAWYGTEALHQHRRGHNRGT